MRKHPNKEIIIEGLCMYCENDQLVSKQRMTTGRTAKNISPETSKGVEDIFCEQARTVVG